MVLGLADSASPRPVLSGQLLTPMGPWEPASLPLSTSAQLLPLPFIPGRELGGDEMKVKERCVPHTVFPSRAWGWSSSLWAGRAMLYLMGESAETSLLPTPLSPVPRLIQFRNCNHLRFTGLPCIRVAKHGEGEILCVSWQKVESWGVMSRCFATESWGAPLGTWEVLHLSISVTERMWH